VVDIPDPRALHLAGTIPERAARPARAGGARSRRVRESHAGAVDGELRQLGSPGVVLIGGIEQEKATDRWVVDEGAWAAIGSRPDRRVDPPRLVAGGCWG